MGRRRTSKKSKGHRPVIVTSMVMVVALVVGWAFLPRSIQRYFRTRWSRLMTRTSDHSKIRRQHSLPLQAKALPATPKLSRFALCLSGDLRTFEATAPSYHDLISANQGAGVDVFGYVGYDPYPYLQQKHGNDSTSAPKSGQGSSDALAHVLAVTANWPGSIVHKSNNSSATSISGPVRQFVVEHEDPWSRLAVQLWTVSHRQNQRQCTKARPIVLQAHKMRQCQLLLDRYVHNYRAGEDYDLIIRSRFDLLLPEPLNLHRIFTVTEENDGRVSEVVSSPTLDSGNVLFIMGIGASSSSSSAVRQQFRGVLFVPFCCDWAGLNDQLAIGTPVAMRAYSERLSHVKIRHGDENSHGDGCPHVGSELACQRAVEHNGLKILRFWYEYTIVRPHHYAAVISARKKVEGAKTSSIDGRIKMATDFAHSMFYACHQMVSASLVYYGFVDLGTMCGEDPRVAFNSAFVNSSAFTQSRQVRRQRRRGGRLRWTASDLKCAILPKKQGIDDKFSCEIDKSRQNSFTEIKENADHGDIGDVYLPEDVAFDSQLQTTIDRMESKDLPGRSSTPLPQLQMIVSETILPVQFGHMRCLGWSMFPKDLPETNYTFWPDTIITADAIGADDTSSSCAHEDADDVATLRQCLSEVGFLPDDVPCVASQQMSVAAAPFGLGSVVNSWLKPYMYAIAHGYTFWSPPLGLYKDQPPAPPDVPRSSISNLNGSFNRSTDALMRTSTATTHSRRCSHNSFACWFEPLSRCETAPYLEGEPPGCRAGASKDEGGRACVPTMGYRNESLSQFSRHAMASDSPESGFPVTSPIRALYNRRGHFWFTSQLLAYLMRPSPHFQQILDSSKVAAGFGSREKENEDSFRRPLLSLHVRHGDSCSARQMRNKKRTCDPLSVYMEQAVLPMAKKYGVKTIFLATDDASLFTAADGICAWPQFKWLYLPPPDAAIHGGYSDAKLKSGEIDGYAEAQNALVDILLLAEGDMFVGKFTSNVDRIAFALMAAQKHQLVPYASLDSPWCSDWGINSGISFYQNQTASFMC